MAGDHSNSFFGNKKCAFRASLRSILIFFVILTGVSDVSAGILEFFGLSPSIPSLQHAPGQNSLIYFRKNSSETIIPYTDSIKNFFNDYSGLNEKYEKNIDHECSRLFSRPKNGKFCPFKLEYLENCSPTKTDGNFGYDISKPCIFLTLNEVKDWTPQVFNETDINQITDDNLRAKYAKMPDFLKEAIANVRDPLDRNLIWVSCEGASPQDVENIGPVLYSPLRGFPASYFPYKNVEGYQSPIVAVQLERPRPGVMITVECKIWAKNLDETKSHTFEILIDS
ncbi:sodium/potassium-transporting ATPase subunit beta-2-like [Contarinia nasturtii]|uniref:sodium/potassium-transporting ATPase subunit beta-2-like n=1 Tax=Contarinia nasturtii TaxID=265458 RepID=UPI0012D3D7C4|nr:sodium/potassium-transporting ATPase subunit beta-2-like [Contarinia nasturtii]